MASPVIKAEDSTRHPRLLCTESQTSGCHLLAYTAFVPSTLSPSYVGIRVGGAYQYSSSSPFPTVSGEYQRVAGSGTVDFAKELWIDRVSLFGSANGSIMTGTNASTLLGADTEAGGGLNVGFVANVLLRKAMRLAVIGQTGRQYGQSVYLLRA